MSQYNCNIENGLKSALFSLTELRTNEKINDNDVNDVINRLIILVEDAQNANIENEGNDE